MKLEIVTQTRKLVDSDVDSVFFPGFKGEAGILPGHAPLLATLGIGELRYRTGVRKSYLAISHGFAEILPDRIIILAEEAEKPEEIDVEKAKEEARVAQEAMQKTYGQELVKARAQLLKAHTQISVAKRISRD